MEVSQLGEVLEHVVKHVEMVLKSEQEHAQIPHLNSEENHALDLQKRQAIAKSLNVLVLV